MQRTDLIHRPKRRPPHFTLLLIAIVAASGCARPPKPGSNPGNDPNCGIFYSCENDQGQRDNDEVNQTAESNTDTSTSTGTGTDPIGD